MKLKITVHGVAYEVDVEVLDAGEGFPPAGALPAPNRPVVASPGQAAAAALPPRPSTTPVVAAGAGTVASPIAGVITHIKVEVGQQVAQGEELLVMEAMKMDSSIAAPCAGKISKILVAAGDSVREGQALIELD